MSSCLFLFLLGSYINSCYIKKIEHYQESYITKWVESESERVCIPYVETDPCTFKFSELKRVPNGPKYKLTIAQGDIPDTTMEIFNNTGPEDYERLSNFIQVFKYP